MFCPKCGKQLEDNTKFCEGCGQEIAKNVTTSAAAPESAPIPPQAQYAYAQNAPVKKKKHIGRWIALVVILAVVGAAAWFAASFFGLVGPKNLGVTYTDKDFQSALAKIGTQITFEGKSGDALWTYSRELKEDGKKFPVAAYDWKHSDYQEKSFTLSSAEATAFLNEIAPAFWWFEDQQIHVLPDGTIEASGAGLLKKALDDLMPEVREKIPFPMFEKVNLYAKGTLSITENKLALNADTFMTGPIEGISAETLNKNSKYFESLYKSVPGLIIHSLTVNSNGGIDVKALIPQKTEIVRKAP